MEERDFLIIRVLLLFWHSETGSIGCTKIAHTLGEEKYTISRVMTLMEKEGLLNKQRSRYPYLTNFGRREAQKYAERIDIIQKHLIYEGLDGETARRDAFYWAVFSSDETLDMIRNMEESYRIRYEFRERKFFSGASLCSKLRDGSYTFPYLIYREQVKNGSNISMANDGFEHPCTLRVENGAGKIFLQAVDMTAESGQTHQKMSGRVNSMKYFDNGQYLLAEKNGGFLTFPADNIQFQNIGSGSGQIIHGTIGLKMTCTVGLKHMPESVAIFTLLI